MKILYYLLLHYVSNVFSENIYPWSSAREEKKLICGTAECEEIGEMYIKHMNPKKNPCTDFYEYACGNWGTINPAPPDADEWNARAVQEVKIQQVLKPILDNQVKYSKLRRTYKICIKRPALDQMSIHKLMTYVEKIEDWPTFRPKVKSVKHPWWAIDDYYISYTGESAFFDIEIVYNHDNQYFPLFQLKPLLSPYGRIIRSYAWEDAEMQEYIEILKDLINACSEYKHTKKTKVSKKDLTDVISFRLALENIAIQASWKKDHPIKVTVADLQKTFEVHQVISKAEPIDWLKIIRSIYENNAPERTNMDTKIEVLHYDYFISLAKLLDKTPEDTIVNHIHLYFVERHLLLDLTWRKKLMNVIYSTQPCVAKKGRIRTLHKRWITCLFNVRTSVDFNRLFVKNFVSPEATNTAEHVLSDLKSVLALEISDSDWMDAETKDKSISKVHDMQAWVGYPKWYDARNLKEKMNLAGASPTQARTCLHNGCNTIFVTAGMLSSPLGCISDAFSATYATVGFLLGHESYHAFDTNGITYDSKGQNLGEWWSSQMLRKYDKQKQCFIDHYEQFLTKELKTKKSQPCDEQQSYDENMADLMGVKLAYQLYKKALFEKQGTCYIPLHLKDFSCDQLFFIAYANTQCSSATLNGIKYSTMNRGSPHRYRVNTPLMNMDEFSKAFHCKPKDAMRSSAAPRCDLWRKTQR